MLISACAAGNGESAHITETHLAGLHAQALARLEPDRPGFGPTDYPVVGEYDIPKANAMVLMSELEHLRARGRELSAIGRMAGHELLATHQSYKGGWGLPFEWDAYADGSVNPAFTVYTISTSIALQALMDWLDHDPNAPREEIENAVIQVVEAYANSSILSHSGLVPYSLSPSDRQYNTFNPAAHIAGQLQRISSSLEPSLRVRAQYVADRTVMALLMESKVSDLGNIYWNYSIEEDIANDLAHAVYIVEGLATYLQYQGRYSAQVREILPAAIMHVHEFVDSRGEVSSWPYFSRLAGYPPRLYEIATLLWASCEYDSLSTLNNAALDSMLRHASAEGNLMKYDPDRIPEAGQQGEITEYIAYALRAISRCRYRPTAELSGFAVDPDINRGSQLAANDYTMVPIDPYYTPFVGTHDEADSFNAQNGAGIIPAPGWGQTLTSHDNGDIGVEIIRTWLRPQLLVRFSDGVEHYVAGSEPTDPEPLYRTSILTSSHLYLVVYDSGINLNRLYVFDVQVAPKPLVGTFVLPKLEDPAGWSYEMVPRMWMGEADDASVYVVGGRMLAQVNHDGVAWSTTLDECERVEETVFAQGQVHFICLAMVLSNNEMPYRIVLHYPSYSSDRIYPEHGIPWGLRVDGSEAIRYNIACTRDELSLMLAHDMWQLPSGGWAELGGTNVEGRLAWSQMYVVSGLLDVLYISEHLPGGASLFAPISAESINRLNWEYAFLQQFWEDSEFSTRGFTTDRSEAKFAVQTSRFLLTMARFIEESVPLDEPLRENQIAWFTHVANNVAALSGHIERSNPRRTFLYWPKGAPFLFDGLNVPFNHQMNFANAVLTARQVLGGESSAVRDEDVRLAERIIEHWVRSVTSGGALPDRWPYWWGTAYRGWSPADEISENMPAYPGDTGDAWVSFRTIDAAAALTSLAHLDPEVANALLESIASHGRRGVVYPSIATQLHQMGHENFIPDARTAVRYARVTSAWEIGNSPWSIYALATNAVWCGNR
jgi:hypothetical protein